MGFFKTCDEREDYGRHDHQSRIPHPFRQRCEFRQALFAEIGHWQFTAYGKTPTAFLTSDEEAIRAATIVSLRDAGASLVSGLERDPRLREWLGVESGKK